MRDREISEGDGIDVHVFTLVIINNLKIRFGIESLESKLECFIERKDGGFSFWIEYVCARLVEALVGE